MLVLSRKEGEKIHIGGGIVITVTGIKGGRVKLGIDAPTHISVVRGELKPLSQLQPVAMPVGASEWAHAPEHVTT